MKEIKFQKKREDYIEGIDEEFQDLANQLSGMDFSKESNKDSVLNATLNNINIEGDSNMKKINKIKKTGIVAASLLIASTLVAQTTFAQGVVNKIIKTISLGHITMVQEEDDELKEVELPDSLKGNVLDKNKNPLEKITKNIYAQGIYTKDGEKIYKIDFRNGTILTEEQAKQVEEKEKEKREENTLCVSDISTLNQYTCFDVKLPTYLPDGYTFKNAEFTKDEAGNVKDSKYASINFENKATGKEIYLQERFACEETRAEGCSDDIEKININGVDAILSEGKNIDWEANNTIYNLVGKNIGKDEVIKVAESIK